MNICILPKSIGIISSDCISDYPYISTSVLNATNDMSIKLNSIEAPINDICNIINPLGYVFSSILDTNISVGKVNPPSNVYYELCEIINDFTLFSPSSAISLLYLGENNNTASLLIDTMRPLHGDSVVEMLYDDSKRALVYCKSFDFIIAKCINISQFMDTFNMVVNTINKNGSVIIKINELFTHKRAIDLLFILTSMFEKVCIVKPTICDVLSTEFFVVCTLYLDNANNYILTNDTNINIPTIFLNKLEEFVSVNGHKQLDAYELFFNLMFHKNRDNKMDLLKKVNIQKSISWCEKNKVMHHKCYDRINIFLSKQPGSYLEEHIFV